MYEKILSALKLKFKEVPGKVLELRAKNLEKTVTEEESIQTAVDGVTLENLFEAYGDSKVTKATKTAAEKAIEKFRKDHNLDENGKPIQAGGGSDDDDDDLDEGGEKMPAWAKKMFSKVDELSTDLSTVKAAKAQEQRAATIAGKLKAAKIPEKLHKRFSVADDADDEAIDTAITEFKQELNDLGISGLREPGGGGSSELSEEEYKKLMSGDESEDDTKTVKLNVD